jgi:hypothetical protein
MTITVDGVRYNLPQSGLCAVERNRGPEFDYDYDYEYAHEFISDGCRKVYKTRWIGFSQDCLPDSGLGC